MANQPQINVINTEFQNSKRRFVYDILGNVVQQFCATYEAGHGDPCWKTVYEYADGKLINTMDFYVTWNSSWDIADPDA